MKRKALPDKLTIRASLTLVLILLAATAYAMEVRKLSLDDVSALGTVISSDVRIKAEGRSAVKISTLGPATICLGEVSDLGVDNTKLVYRAKVRCQNLKGTAFLEMWCHLSGGRYFSRGLDSTVSGNTDWQTIQTVFFLQAGQKPDKVTLNIAVQGEGTVWVDDVRLLKEPL